MTSALERSSLVFGLIGVCLCFFGAITNQSAFYAAYLQAYGFWLLITLGCLGFFLLHGLVGGRWGAALVPFLKAGFRNLPLLILLFIPIVIGMPYLYKWTNLELMANDHLLHQKVAYLNKSFFFIRSGIYFGSWIIISFLAASSNGGKKPGLGVSGVSTFVLVLTLSFAAFDWFMSIEPEWFSSLYGGIFLADSILGTLAFLLVVGNLFGAEYPKMIWHDIGKLTYMGIMLWAYLSFSQYLIIWSGNLPEELVWYHHRAHGGWSYVGLVLILLHFALPFLLLLSQRLKQNPKYLMKVAIFILIMRCVDMWWTVAPAFHDNIWYVPIWEISALVAIGGLWFFFFSRAVRKRLPIGASGSMKEG